MDRTKAKESWKSAGLTDQGIAAINGWIDELADNIERGQGRWDAYWRNAFYTSDPRGSVKILHDIVAQTKA